MQHHYSDSNYNEKENILERVKNRFFFLQKLELISFTYQMMVLRVVDFGMFLIY